MLPIPLWWRVLQNLLDETYRKYILHMFLNSKQKQPYYYITKNEEKTHVITKKLCRDINVFLNI